MINLPNIVDGENKSSAFGNCLRNRYKHIRKWAKRTQTNCFRIYDRDIAHYPVAIDLYAGRFCVHFYASSKQEPEPPQELIQEINSILIALFDTDAKQIYWRTRIKSKTSRQYEKHEDSKDFFVAYEYGVKFYINLRDYLDTGLFLDHRETRQLVAGLSKQKKVLNLFAYTCSFSVQAAHAGAAFTKSVDMSNTYTEWGKNNFILNEFSLKNHQIVRADCLKFLEKEIDTLQRYDLIVIDPPTISRSKKMDQLFDIQIDYIPLLNKALMLLEKNGTIIFSTNFRRFIFDETLFPFCSIQEITHKTIPVDFANQKLHRCWKITLLA